MNKEEKVKLVIDVATKVLCTVKRNDGTCSARTSEHTIDHAVNTAVCLVNKVIARSELAKEE